MAAEVHIQEEHYTFKPETKKSIFYMLALGLLLFGIGFFQAYNSTKEGGEHGGGHAAIESQKMTASIHHESSSEPAKVSATEAAFE